MNRFITAVVLVGLILAGPGSVFSAEPKGEREKIEDRIESFATWEMLGALNLDQATADKVLAIRHKFATQKKELNRALGEDLAKLRQLLKEDPKSVREQELAETVARVRETRKKLRELKDERVNEVSKVLTVRQQAQLILFFHDFWRQMRGMAHGQHRFGPPGGRGRDVSPPMGPRPQGRGPGLRPEQPGPRGLQGDQD